MSHSTFEVTLAVKLRRLLADHQISGRELARRTDMSPASCSRALRGERDLTVSELQRVAEALDVDVRDLIDTPVQAAS